MNADWIETAANMLDSLATKLLNVRGISLPFRIIMVKQGIMKKRKMLLEVESMCPKINNDKDAITIPTACLSTTNVHNYPLLRTRFSMDTDCHYIYTYFYNIIDFIISCV